MGRDMRQTSDPYELLVDRYTPGASEEERAEARRNMDQFIALLIRIDDRIAQESCAPDSHETERCGRVEPDSKGV